MNTKHAPVFILLTRITLAWREITRKNVVERVELKTLHPAETKPAVNIILDHVDLST